MILTDKEIKEMKLISPIVDKVKCNISYGLDPSGYTLCLDNEFWIPKKPKWWQRLLGKECILDPMNPEETEKCFDKIRTDAVIIPPKSFILAKAKEFIGMPTDTTGIALTKSTYARVGIFANITYLDPNWRGYLTIEIANLGYNPVKIYANYGIAMITFHKHNEPELEYEGKYQNLEDIKI